MISVGIIGGGAAGMMAALSAAKAGGRVTLIERGTAPGAKLLLTGGGRCNFSHDCEARDFVQVIGRPGRFLGHALAALDPAGTREFFAQIGVPSVVEPDGRVVPVSQRAVDVRRALVEALSPAGVTLVTGTRVFAVARTGTTWRVECEKGDLTFDRVILATGGMSYPATGSDGSGFELARSSGHAVNQPLPAEVPLITSDFPIDRLVGLTVLDVRLSIAGDRTAATRGNLLFTHFGISGPAVLDISGSVAEALYRGKKVAIVVDLVPDMDDDDAAGALSGGVATLRRIVPSRLAAVVADMAAGARPGESLSALRKMPIPIVKTRGFDHSMVTRGGVNLSGVDQATMQSKQNEGLYFAGEILDLDGPMGGYNLQIAWSTGWLAGRSAARP